METLALRIVNTVADGSKLTVENETIIGKAAALAYAMGYLTVTATSPSHTTYTSR